MFELIALIFMFVLAGAGCAPSLNNPIPVDDDDATAVDDDDTTAADDDDTTWADDDDSTWGDDDDVVGPDCSNEGSSVAWASGPSDIDGVWVDGTITVDEDLGSLTLVSAAGVTSVWRLGDQVALLSGVAGEGRVYWSQPGLGSWGGDHVLAVEAFGDAFHFASAYVVGQTEVFIPDWAARFSALPGACGGELVESSCGLLEVLAMEYEVPSWNGLDIGVLYPEQAVVTSGLFVSYGYGVEYIEALCEDLDMMAWSFSMQQSLKIWDGGERPPQ